MERVKLIQRANECLEKIKEGDLNLLCEVAVILEEVRKVGDESVIHQLLNSLSQSVKEGQKILLY